MFQIISAILVVGGTGLIFGAILAFASFVFKIDEDERIGLITAELPGANCGACGYAGCGAYASAVVEGIAPVNLCSVGKSMVAEKIALIMDCESEEIEPMVAHIMCSGNCNSAKDKFEYQGIPDCVSAYKIAGGAKSCPGGCLGLGSCAAVCPFDAIYIEDGIAKIDMEKCVACGKCTEKCPKKIIRLIPKSAVYIVDCSSHTNGASTIKNCTSGCIGCKLCEKNCPSGAIKVTDNLASIDYSLCTECGVCAEKCPKKIIHITNRG